MIFEESFITKLERKQCEYSIFRNFIFRYEVDDAEELLRVDGLGNSSAPSLLSTDDEVRILKRHMTRLATRVFAIEQEQQYRNSRDFYVYLLMAAYVSFKAFNWIRSSL